MARLLGPDMGSRMVVLPSGARAGGLNGTVYANSTGTILADILAYQPSVPGTPGAVIAGSVLTTDAYGLLPLFWFPDGLVDRVWITVNAGPLVPIDADYNARQDALDARVAAIEPAGATAALRVGSNLADVASAATARANLGVAYGTTAGTVTQGSDTRIQPWRPVAGAGDGVADDRAAIVVADTAASTSAAVLLRPGTYRVASNLTVSAPVVMLPGAVIKPDNGITVILAGGVEAPRRQVFDHSVGGVVAPRKVDFYHPAWWGATGGVDDTAAWTAMASALSASKVNDATTGIDFGQRILAPIGVNRFFGVSLSNCHLVAEKGTSIFYPAGTPTTGSMLTVGDYCTITGGYWRTNGTTQAVNLINFPGFRSRVENVYMVPAAAGSVGINVGTGPTSTPVLSDIQINPVNKLGTGILLNSADCEMTDIWIGNCNIGLDMLRGASRISNLHIWGCNTGMSSAAADELEISGMFLDSNLGWGCDLDLPDRNVFSNFHVWNNGAGTPGTGGIRLRKSTAGSARDNILSAGAFDDNTGVGLLLDGVTGTDVVGVRFGSRSVQSGGAVVCDTGVRVTAASSHTSLKIRARRVDHITAVVDDLSTSAVELGTARRVLTADVPFTANTGIATILSWAVEPGERWILDGLLLVDGPQAADVKIRLQGTSSTGVTGTLAVPNAPATANVSTTAASVNPANAVAVLATGGSTIVPGLAGVGILQALTLVGHVLTGTVTGSLELQAAQNVSDPGTTTIRAGSWLRGVRVG